MPRTSGVFLLVRLWEVLMVGLEGGSPGYEVMDEEIVVSDVREFRAVLRPSRCSFMKR